MAKRDHLAAQFTAALNTPEGLDLLRATERLMDPPRAPTASGYWLGLLMGEPIDREAAARREAAREGAFS